MAKKTKRYLSLLLVLMALVVFVSGCGSHDDSDDSTDELSANNDPAGVISNEGKRVLWVESYNSDYDWTAGLERGVQQALDGSGVELQIVHMDTLNNPSDEFCKQAGLDAKATIDEFQPDVIMASDDNVQRCLVVPHLMDAGIPIVFAGVNWDASGYGYPTENITGMLQVDLIELLMEQLKSFANGDRVAYVGPNVTTEQRVVEIYQERFFADELIVYFVTDFEDFKTAYLDAQINADMLLFGGSGGIQGWDDAEALTFLAENTKIPSGGRRSDMIPFTLISLIQLEEEQGGWMATTALDILGGKAVADIPITQNRESILYLNFDLAAVLDTAFSPGLLSSAEIYPAQATGDE